MKTIHNFDECLEYVNRLGIVNPSKPIGWRQSDLCAIVDGLTRIADFQGGYPFTIRYHRRESFQSLVFEINAGQYRLTYPDSYGHCRAIL